MGLDRRESECCVLEGQRYGIDFVDEACRVRELCCLDRYQMDGRSERMRGLRVIVFLFLFLGKWLAGEGWSVTCDRAGLSEVKVLGPLLDSPN